MNLEENEQKRPYSLSEEDVTPFPLTLLAGISGITGFLTLREAFYLFRYSDIFLEDAQQASWLESLHFQIFHPLLWGCGITLLLVALLMVGRKASKSTWNLLIVSGVLTLFTLMIGLLGESGRRLESIRLLGALLLVGLPFTHMVKELFLPPEDKKQDEK